MSYKQDLKDAKTIKECQEAYLKESEKRYNKFLKSDPDNAFDIMICKDFNIWIKAEERAHEISGYPDGYTLIQAEH